MIINHAAYQLGLSPHSRGTLYRLDLDHSYYRFIPALTGNTSMYILTAISAPVYPRTHGEHEAKLELVRMNIRFIPALTGNTEKLEMVNKYAHGLSPHSRGTLIVH